MFMFYVSTGYRFKSLTLCSNQFQYYIAVFDSVTGQFFRTSWDTSTDSEFSVIWSRMLEKKYFNRETREFRGEYKRLVVDIGAMDGVCGSNSWNFINAGFDAVLVEPFPRHIARLKENLQGFLFNDEALQSVQLAEGVVSDKDGSVSLTIFSDNSKTSNTVLSRGR